MSKTFRQWVLFSVVCIAVGFMVNAMSASLGTTGDEARNEVRMGVDFTVLPVLKPEETSPPAPSLDEPQPDAEQAAADMPSKEVAVKPTPEASPEPAPASQPIAPDQPGQVAAVSLEETPLGFTVTIRTDPSVQDTSYINLANPRRLVIDLLGNWNYRGKNVIRSKGMVKHIVIGEHKDRLRLVAHFRTPPANKLKPQFKVSGNELFVLVPKQ